jgi:hypothetical protein
MHKIWFAVALAALIAGSASAQDYSKNFVECTKNLGMHPDVGTQKLSDGRMLRSWYIYDEHQQAAFSDCVARKASLGRNPSAGGKPRASR